MTRPGRFLFVAAVLVACTSSPPAADIGPTSTVAPIVSTTSSVVATTTTLAATTTTRRVNPNPAHAYPVPSDITSSFSRTHAGYPATDVFAACGSPVLALVDGVVIQVRREDRFDKAVNNPALRGGPSVAILGDDGVRYYASHLGDITVSVGDAVEAGEPIGVITLSGDSGACHTHIGLSPTCPGPEWSVRRGVIWPWPYLDAWRKGEATKSPAPEILAWMGKNPDACAKAMADPNAPDAA